jgi:hypothetical protein
MVSGTPRLPAPDELGLKRTTLVYKMKRLGIFQPQQRLMGEFDEGYLSLDKLDSPFPAV